MVKFTVRQQRAGSDCHITVGTKPVTIWLKPPANSDQAKFVADFLEANVEDIEFISTGMGRTDRNRTVKCGRAADLCSSRRLIQ
jgi:hypothetical protein